MSETTVYVVEHIHKHGNDLSAYATREDAEAARAEIARMYLTDDLLWREDNPDADVDAMTDEEAVEAWFTPDNEDECYIWDLTVQGARS